MDDKNFLLTLLTLSDNAIKDDLDKLNPIINTLNTAELTTQQIETLNTNVASLIDPGMPNIVDGIKLIINGVTGLNKNYLLALIDIRFLDFKDLSLAKSLVESKLLDTSITFDNNVVKYNYYYVLSNLAINLKDNALIEQAINMVQSL